MLGDGTIICDVNLFIHFSRESTYFRRIPFALSAELLVKVPDSGKKRMNVVSDLPLYVHECG